MNDQPTNQDIIEAISDFSTHTDKKFDQIETRLDHVETRLGRVETQLDHVETKLNSVSSQMVTKEYFDEKTADLRGDIQILIRKEDRKFGALVEELLKQKILSEEAAKRILSMEPFAKTF